MMNHRSIRGSIAVVLVTGFCLAPAVRLAAERAGSLTEQQIEVSEAKTAMETLARENSRLKAKLEQSEAALANTQKNLTNSMSEAEEFRRKASELKVRLEALGLDGAGGNIEKLQQRLLRAVSDLKLAEDERKKLKEALIQLSETILTFKKSSVTNDPEALEAMEVAMRSTAQALGVTVHDVKDAAPVSASLQDGMVLSLQEELALVVANLGSRQGVKVGMPFQVLRNGNVIGTVRVVDVRESIAGAVIQDLSSDKEKIRQGDRLRVDARQ